MNFSLDEPKESRCQTYELYSRQTESESFCAYELLSGRISGESFGKDELYSRWTGDKSFGEHGLHSNEPVVGCSVKAHHFISKLMTDRLVILQVV